MYIDFSLKSTNRDLWRLEYVSFYSNHTIQYSVYYKLLSMRANLQHMALLSVRGIKKHFGGVIVLDGVDMDLERGKVYQLIGSNGSGKTTLVDIISGRIHSDEGNVILDGNDITQSGQLETYRAGLVRTFQIPRPFRKLATINVHVLKKLISLKFSVIASTRLLHMLPLRDFHDGLQRRCLSVVDTLCPCAI